MGGAFPGGSGTPRLPAAVTWRSQKAARAANPARREASTNQTAAWGAVSKKARGGSQLQVR